MIAHIQMCATLNQGEKDRNKESEAESATTITDSNSGEDLVLEEIGSSSSEEDNLPLSVLVSQSKACRDTDGESDRDVPLSTLQNIQYKSGHFNLVSNTAVIICKFILCMIKL